MPKFATDRVQSDWSRGDLNPVVRQIVMDAQDYALRTYAWEFTITSIFRTPEEDKALLASGVHVEGRAVDVRVRGLPKAVVADVAGYINGRWTYDPTRPALNVCFSEPHGTGPHMHFQVHRRTVENQ